MNRYVRDAIVNDITEGRRVLAFFGRMDDAKFALNEVAEAMHEGFKAGRGDYRAYFAHGHERVAHLGSGGQVDFRSANRSTYAARGYEVDKIYSEVAFNGQQLTDVMPALSATRGELIYFDDASLRVATTA